jgi:hypothetical protein
VRIYVINRPQCFFNYMYLFVSYYVFLCLIVCSSHVLQLQKCTYKCPSYVTIAIINPGKCLFVKYIVPPPQSSGSVCVCACEREQSLNNELECAMKGIWGKEVWMIGERMSNLAGIGKIVYLLCVPCHIFHRIRFYVCGCVGGGVKYSVSFMMMKLFPE